MLGFSQSNGSEGVIFKLEEVTVMRLNARFKPLAGQTVLTLQ